MLFGDPADRGADRSDALSAEPPTRLMARILAALFGAGATLAVATLVLPHSAEASEAGLMAVIVNAYLVAAILSRITSSPSWLLPVALAWGTSSITAVSWFSGQAPSPFVFFYLWVFLYSAYFLSRRLAAAQIAWVGVAYGALLFAGPDPGSDAVSWWLVAMGSLIVGALVIVLMRDRVDLLIERLFESARRDPLTQLTNRQGFREHLDLELERARRNGLSIAVLVIDVDHFKRVNDLSGHHSGDDVLRRLAGVLGEDRRRTDAVARIGGEEFALVCPDADAEGALEIAEQLRTRIAERFAADALPITISTGIAVYPAHGETASALLAAVDEALYEAKSCGRNRSALYSSNGSAPSSGHAKRLAGQDSISAERFVSVMLDLAATVDMRFSGSARHSETVGRYAELMARELGLPEQRIGRVRLAGMLHDIGKAVIPDAILHKPGRLSEEEFVTIKTHPGLGAEILDHPGLADVRSWVGAHHERPDGRGYPLGIGAEEICLEAKILAVADAFEAMTSVRSYSPSIEPELALAELERCAGTQFDQAVVTSFRRAQGRELRAESEPVPA